MSDCEQFQYWSYELQSKYWNEDKLEQSINYTIEFDKYEFIIFNEYTDRKNGMGYHWSGKTTNHTLIETKLWL